MTTAHAKKSRTTASHRYMELIADFPLKPIRNDREHGRAVEIIGQLIGRKLDDGASDYLETLLLLTNKFEDEHHSPTGIEMTSRETLKAIMSANGMTQANIGRIIGSESVVSMFLSGQRELSKSQIRALATRFRINAGLFIRLIMRLWKSYVPRHHGFDTFKSDS